MQAVDGEVMKLKQTFSLRTGGLLVTHTLSHCNFNVLACVCEDHTQDLQLNFSLIPANIPGF